MDAEVSRVEEAVQEAQPQQRMDQERAGVQVEQERLVVHSTDFPVPFLVTTPLGSAERDVAAMVAAGAPTVVAEWQPQAHAPVLDAAAKRGRKPHADTAGGSHQKRQRAKKPADSPRRPKSAYMFFLAEFREQWKKDNPDSKKVADVAKAAGEAWRNLSEEDKSKFELQSTEDKAQYAAAMERYNQEHPKPHRRAKKERDPGELKRPQSAYFFFLADFREAYKREHPGDQPQVALMGKLAGDKWKSMTPEERAPYEQMSSASKAEYKKLKSMTADQRMAAAATAAMQAIPSGAPSSVPSGESEPPAFPSGSAAPSTDPPALLPGYEVQDEELPIPPT